MNPTGPSRHTRAYRILNHDLRDPVRTVEVHASPEQLQHLEEEGYLVRERLLTKEHLEQLRAAADEIAAQERPQREVAASRRFGGLFVRSLLDRHPAFLDMLKFEPTLSVARAVLGPQVQVHAFVLRVSCPDQPNQETHWHFHQRVIPDSLPAFFSRPHVIDNLIYLDDLNEANGPLCVVPRSHRWDQDLPAEQFGNLTGQVVLELPAGSCVTSHASLWHRAMPTRPEGSIRRLLILGYSPTWMKPIDPFGEGLTAALHAAGDSEVRELLGLGGYY